MIIVSTFAMVLCTIRQILNLLMADPSAKRVIVVWICSSVFSAMMIVALSAASAANSSMNIHGARRILFDRLASKYVFWATTTIIPVILSLLAPLIFLAQTYMYGVISSVYFCLFLATAVITLIADIQLVKTLNEFKRLKVTRSELGVHTYSDSTETNQSTGLSLEKNLVICSFALILICLLSTCLAAALLMTAITAVYARENTALVIFPWITYDVLPGYFILIGHSIMIMWLHGVRWITRLIDRVELDSPILGGKAGDKTKQPQTSASILTSKI